MKNQIVRVLCALVYCAVAEKPALISLWILAGHFDALLVPAGWNPFSQVFSKLALVWLASLI